MEPLLISGSLLVLLPENSKDRRACRLQSVITWSQTCFTEAPDARCCLAVPQLAAVERLTVLARSKTKI